MTKKRAKSRLQTLAHEVLFHSQLRADRSIVEIAARAGCRPHTARRLLQSLSEEGAIQAYPFVNTYPLGFEEYGIFFSLASGKREREKLFSELEETDRVSWILELGGDYQYGIALCAKNAGEIAEFLDALSTRHGDIFFEKSIAVRLSWQLFPRRYLSASRAHDRPLACGRTGETVELDDLDHRILSFLSSSAYSSYRDAARKIGVPHSTLLARLRSLKEKKVLMGFAYGVNASAFGMQSYRLLVYLKQVSVTVKKAITDYCRSQRNIVAIIDCLGSWDFEIKVETESNGELGAVMEGLYESCGAALQTVKVLTVFRTRKLEFYPFRNLPGTDLFPPQAKARRAAFERVKHFD